MSSITPTTYRLQEKLVIWFVMLSHYLDLFLRFSCNARLTVLETLRLVVISDSYTKTIDQFHIEEIISTKTIENMLLIQMKDSTVRYYACSDREQATKLEREIIQCVFQHHLNEYQGESK